jgi:hypothetical protein
MKAAKLKIKSSPYGPNEAIVDIPNRGAGDIAIAALTRIAHLWHVRRLPNLCRRKWWLSFLRCRSNDR